MTELDSVQRKVLNIKWIYSFTKKNVKSIKYATLEVINGAKHIEGNKRHKLLHINYVNKLEKKIVCLVSKYKLFLQKI